MRTRSALPRRSTLAVVLLVAVFAGMPVAAQQPGLRAGADASGINFGAAVTSEALAEDDAYRQLLIDNVNLLSTVTEFDMAVVQPQPGVFDFSRADAIVDFAADNDMQVRGHGLISDDGLPDWVVNGAWTAETLSEVLRTQVTAVVSRYAERNPGVVTQYDVVDEAFLADGSRRPSIWQQTIGDAFVPIAFEAARAADPDALLFYDDFYDDLAITQDAVASGVAIVPGASADRSSCADVPKCVGVEAALSALIDAGAPIDGIGVQAHLLSPDPLDFTAFTTWIDALGLIWAVTEFDVPVPVTEVTSPETLAFQADTYAAGLSACIDAPGCDTFVTWGITDRLPPAPDASGGAFGGGLWLDVLDAPKPAADAMSSLLTAALAAPTTTALADEATSPTAPTTLGTDVDALTDDGSSTAPTALVVGAVALAAVVVAIALLRSRRPETQPDTAKPDLENP